MSFMTDKLCEELAFPVLFPKGRFGYTASCDIKLSPVKYFNTRLLHYSGRFASNPEYLFFAQFIIEQKKVSDSTNIAHKKVHGKPVTASQVRSNTQVPQNLISQDLHIYFWGKFQVLLLQWWNSWVYQHGLWPYHVLT